MDKKALQPYVAYEFYTKDNPRFTFCIQGIRWTHYPAHHYLHLVSYDVCDGERILFHHASGLHILYGENLTEIVGLMEQIGTYRVFDPASHFPVENASAPIIRRYEVKNNYKGTFNQNFMAPHLRVLED